MKLKKVTVIGAGNVGATCAQRIVEANLADVVLIDIVYGLAEGKALDVMQSAPIMKFDASIEGTTDFGRSRGSDIIVITAGLVRKPGMSRDDLLIKNASIIKEIVQKVAPLSPKAVLLIVTNPLDVMCYITQKYSSFPHKRVIGMAGELDSARMSHFVRERLNNKVGTMKTLVLGTHGDAMVPLPRLSTVGKKPVDKLISARILKAIVDKTKKGGAQIVSLLQTGSAFYAPSAAVFAMVRSIIHNTNELFCCSVFLQGEYDIHDTYCGVPVTLGKEGIRDIVELELNQKEKALLKNSSQTIKANIDKIRSL